MFGINPPAAPREGTDPGPMSITRIVRRAFDVPSAGTAGPDPELDRFLADLVAPYGLAPYPDPVDETYAGMAEALLGPAGLLETSVDLIVLAHAVPDADPRPSAAHRLGRLCPGDPLAFALSDQGIAAPFTALALAREYLRAGGCGRALVLVLEQAALPYPAAASVDLPDHGSAVALVLERAGPVSVRSVDQRTAVAPEGVGAVLAGLTAAAGPDPVVVLGPALARNVGAVEPARFRLAPAGQQCTAVWWELADLVVECGADAPGILVADYDPELGYLCALTIGAS